MNTVRKVQLGVLGFFAVFIIIGSAIIMAPTPKQKALTQASAELDQLQNDCFVTKTIPIDQCDAKIVELNHRVDEIGAMSNKSGFLWY